MLLKPQSLPPTPVFRVSLMDGEYGGRPLENHEIGCRRFELVGKNFRKRKKITRRLGVRLCAVLMGSPWRPSVDGDLHCHGWRYGTFPSFYLLLSLFFSRLLSWTGLVGLKSRCSFPLPPHSLLSLIKKSNNNVLCLWSELSSAGDDRGTQNMDCATIVNPLNTPRKGPKSHACGLHSSEGSLLPKVDATPSLPCRAGRKDNFRFIDKDELKILLVLAELHSISSGSPGFLELNSMVDYP